MNELQRSEEQAPLVVQEMGIEAAEKRLALVEKRRTLVLRTLNVTDVAKLGEALAKNKYAAEKLHEIFGGRYELLKDNNGKPLCDVQKIEDDDVGCVYIYTYYGRYERPDGKVVEQMGSFSSKDPFFAQSHGTWKHVSEINLVDIMAAAQTEAYKKCLFRGCGLGDWDTAEKQQLLGQAKGHSFQGSQAGVGKEAKPVGFGKSKGMMPADLGDSDLAWYTKAYTENAADPAKARFKAANQAVLDGLIEEQARRNGGVIEDGGITPDAPPPTAPKTKAAKQLALRQKLTGVCKTVPGATSGLILSALAEVDSITDLSDVDLDRLLGISEDELLNVAAVITEKE